jgi:hypothetical protein
LKQYQIKLIGPEARGARISGFVLRDLLNVLTEGTLGALRLKIEGQSSAKGPVPAWLKASAKFDLIGLDKGSTVVLVEAPSLAEAAPDRFAQPDFFQDLDVNRSSFSLMEDALQDALKGDPDSDAYDDGLIQVFEGFSGLLGPGVRSIQIRGDRDLEITPEGVGQVGKLRRQTPAPRRVRVAGKIETIRHSDRMFTLILDKGTTVRGIAEGVPADRLALLFGKVALVSGTGVFRPSGSLLRIEADHLEPAVGDVSVWSQVPKPLEGGTPDSRRFKQPQSSRSGLNAVFGAWPGNESDDEVKARLAELS